MQNPPEVMDELNGSIIICIILPIDGTIAELYVRFSIDNDVSKSMILCMRVLD